MVTILLSILFFMVPPILQEAFHKRKISFFPINWNSYHLRGLPIFYSKHCIKGFSKINKAKIIYITFPLYFLSCNNFNGFQMVNSWMPMLKLAWEKSRTLFFQPIYLFSSIKQCQITWKINLSHNNFIIFPTTFISIFINNYHFTYLLI